MLMSYVRRELGVRQRRELYNLAALVKILLLSFLYIQYLNYRVILGE